MKTITIYLPSDPDLQAFASQLAVLIPPGGIIFLYGPLGAGKTTFTRGFLRGLGYPNKVKSPTYTIVEPYEAGGKKIFHFDFYRLQNPQELMQLGIQEYFSPDVISLIEWPEKGLSILPEADLACYIAFKDQGREIRIEARSGSGEKVLGALLKELE